MRITRQTWIATLLTSLLLAFSISMYAKMPASVIAEHHDSISSMLNNTMPAVVNIICTGDIPLPNDPFLKQKLDRLEQAGIFKNKQFNSVGSGVIVEAQHGLIITNTHVVNLAKSITVTLSDGRRFEATKVGQDDNSDIALLRIRADHLTALPFADSSRLKIGDFVAAIGSPYGLNQTVTSGMISALHRSGLGLEGIEDFIQIDATIDVGSSGGALVNTRGELIGINTAAIAASKTGGNVGIGFAIPSNMVHSVMEQLLKYGEVQRGMMGILVQTLTPNIADTFHKAPQKGSIVTQIIPHSPAAQAGLKAGDIITAVDDHPVQSNGDVQSMVGLLHMGSTVKLTVIRDGKTLQLPIITVDPKNTEEKNKEALPYLYGMTMENIDGYSSTHGSVRGVHVLSLKPYAPAMIAGLQEGDLIISANHQPTPNIKALFQAAKNAPRKTGLLLHYIRGKGAAFAVVQ